MCILVKKIPQLNTSNLEYGAVYCHAIYYKKSDNALTDLLSK